MKHSFDLPIIFNKRNDPCRWATSRGSQEKKQLNNSDFDGIQTCAPRYKVKAFTI